MNLLDTNIWIALVISNHVFRTKVDDWFAAQSARGSILFCRSTQLSFLRLLTTEQFMGQYNAPAFGNSAAWSFLEKFLSDPRIAIAPEPSTIDRHWRSFAVRKTASPKLWMDAYLAAFAVAGGHKFVTTDKAFEQFAGLSPTVLTL